jgi:hypothetical protein
MKRFSGYLICSSLALIVLSSCAKDEPEPADPNDPGTVPTLPPYFTWKVNNGSQVVADSSHCYVKSNVIFAFRNGNANTVEINLASMSVGKYLINTSSGNELKYQTGSLVGTGTGTVNILTSGQDRISGDFNCALSGGTLTSITGTFTDIPKRFN